jgi:hypothetical protein
MLYSRVLFTSGRSGWAEAVQKLYEEHNREVRENQKIQDELTSLYRSYQR